MLTGIAMGQGAFQSMSERVVSFFADRSLANLDENKGNMTLVDLLTLRAGLSCSDDAGAVMAMYQSRDWVKFTLDLPMAGAPRTQFRYCSPAVHLLSPILRVATGKDPRELANEALVAPLGIAPMRPGEWDTDPQRNPEAFSGLRLTPRDMAKLGFLYLHGGNWDGNQVVPANWVVASLTPHAVEPKSGRSYGYLFWIFDKQGYYGALSRGGQDIYIIPSKNIVVVFTGALDDAAQVQQTVRLLDEYIVPAAVRKGPWPTTGSPGPGCRRVYHARPGSGRPRLSRRPWRLPSRARSTRWILTRRVGRRSR